MNRSESTPIVQRGAHFRGNLGTARQTTRTGRWALGLLVAASLMPVTASAQNPMTLLNCGAPPVVDSYEGSTQVQDDRPVGGPMKCSTAADLANALNNGNGCCQQQYIDELKKLAERRAESECNEKVGANFACDIFRTKTSICSEGCGLSTTPVDSPLGCVAPRAHSQCSGTARVVPAHDESKCLVMCDVAIDATAAGKFSVGCGTCTAEANCEALGEIEVRKRAEVAELEERKRALEAELAALSPSDPDYMEKAGRILVEIAAVVSRMSNVVGFLMNLKKVFTFVRAVVRCFDR